MSADGAPTSAGSSSSSWMLSLLIGVVGAAGAWLLGSSGAQSPLIWTTSALAAGATLRWGWRQGALVMLGHVLVNLAHGLDPRLIARGVAYGMLGALSLRGLLDLVGFRRTFEHIRDVGRFVVAAAAAGTVPALLLAAMRTTDAGTADPTDIALQALKWSFNSAMMMMLVVPPLVGAGRATVEGWRRRPRTALALLALATSIAAVGLAQPAGYAWLVLLGLSVVATSAMYFDVAFSGALALLFAVATILGIGWASFGEEYDLAALQSGRAFVYSALLSGLMLTVHALRAERVAAESRLQAARVRFRLGVLSMAVREQERIGQDVRRRLGFELTSLGTAIDALEQEARTSAPRLGDDIAAMREACQRAREATEAVAHGLIPPIDRDGDLGRALQRLASRIPAAAGIEISIACEPGLALPAESSRDAYRIVQEALNNVLKHARARRVQVSLARDAGDHVRIVVEDDGVGFDPGRRNGIATNGSTAAARGVGSGVGLRTMRYRAEIAGGELVVEPRAAGGTRVSCRLPTRRPDEARTGRADTDRSALLQSPTLMVQSQRNAAQSLPAG